MPEATTTTTPTPPEPADETGSVILDDTNADVADGPDGSDGVAPASAESATAPASASVVPEKYEFVSPEGFDDPAIVERTAATARELGLSNEAGQKLLDATAKAIQDREAAADKAWAEANKPGGSEWKKRDQAWRAAVQADPEIGGTPDNTRAVREKANTAVRKFFSAEGTQLIKDSGLGSHPEFVRAMYRIGKAMSESAPVFGSTGAPGQPKTQAEILYGEKGYVERVPTQ